ncbi:hypothetical protein JCM10207_006914 [Rhodosporidiobolus poonsookiae]
MSPSGSSTDYDALPSPPARLSRHNPGRGRAARVYGKRARPVTAAAPVEGAQEREGGGSKGGGAARAARRGRERGESSSEDEGEGAEGRKRVGRVQGARGKKHKGARAREEKLGEEEEKEEGKVEQGTRRAVRARQDKVAWTASSRQPSQSTLPSLPAPTAASLQHNGDATSSKLPRSVDALAQLDPAPHNVGSPHLPPSVRLAKVHSAVRAHQLPLDPSQMTPRSRARALGDKSNRSSLPSSPAGGQISRAPSRTDSPRSRPASHVGSRRCSLALNVFRDPAASAPPSTAPAPARASASAEPALADLPTRRRPLPRAASHSRVTGSSAPTSISLLLPLPRSPSASHSPRPLPRARTASPRAALRSPLYPASSAAAGVGATHLGVPGAPQLGQAPRLPPPWSLVAPPSSSPASLGPGTSGAPWGAAVEEEGGEKPVFRFTTTQFADLPSVVLPASPLVPRGGDGDATIRLSSAAAGRLDDDAFAPAGMDSSFMLFEEGELTREGEAGWEGAGMFEDESAAVEVTVVSGKGGVEAAEEEDVRELAEEEQEEEEMQTEGEETIRAEPAAMDVDVLVSPPKHTPEAVGDPSDPVDLVGAVPLSSLSLAGALPLSSPSTSCPSPAPIPPSPPPFSAHRMPRRRPRPILSSPLPSGPPTSEDDLAYYLRVTGTFSSEDDLSPASLPSPGGSSAEENALAEQEVGRAVKPSSSQRDKRVAAASEARRAREQVEQGLRIGAGKDGRRRGWKREILSPVKGWRAVKRVRPARARGGVGEGYEADEGERDEEEDELAMEW